MEATALAGQTGCNQCETWLQGKLDEARFQLKAANQVSTLAYVLCSTRADTHKDSRASLENASHPG